MIGLFSFASTRQPFDDGRLAYFHTHPAASRLMTDGRPIFPIGAV
jgi:hypothetical protein